MILNVSAHQTFVVMKNLNDDLMSHSVLMLVFGEPFWLGRFLRMICLIT